MIAIWAGRRRGFKALLILPAMPAIVASQALAQNTFTGTTTSTGPFSSGKYEFKERSTLNANSANTVSGKAHIYFYNYSTLNATVVGAIDSTSLADGTQLRFYDYSVFNIRSGFATTATTQQQFYGDSTLNALTANALNAGNSFYYGNAQLNATADNAISGGNQTFDGGSALNASANAISGGAQFFQGSSKLNATGSAALHGGYQLFYDNSQLVASGGAIAAGNQIFSGNSVLNANAAAAVAGGTQKFGVVSTRNTKAGPSALNANAAAAVVGGTQSFEGISALNAQASNAIAGGTQSFVGSSALNANAAAAVAGGTQKFDGTSALNAQASNAITGGTQSFIGSSALNANAAAAVAGGTQKFDGTSALNAQASNAITGGTQSFIGSSALNANAAAAVAGGTQSFEGTSALNAQASNAIAGGTQSFIGSSALNANAATAVNGGMQSFDYSSAFNAAAANAIIAGTQSFHGNSSLNAQVAASVAGGNQYLLENSKVNVFADNALTGAAHLHFDNQLGGVGGTLSLGGHMTTVGGITSESRGSGLITNGDTDDAILTVDSTTIGADTFSGTINDGGTGRLTLVLAGGTLTFSGTASHTGGTIVSNGTLLVGDSSGAGTLGGDVSVQRGGTLGGSGTLTGEVTIDGRLSAGNSPGTLTFTHDLTLSPGSTSLFEFNSPGVVGGTGVAGNDLVEVGGKLTVAGALEARVAAAGYYRLFDYGTLAPGSGFASESIVSTDAGFTPVNYAVRYNIPGQVNLLVLGTGQRVQFWDGSTATANGTVDGGDGVWQGFGTNWTSADGSGNAGWANSVAVFSGQAGTVSVRDDPYFDTLQFSTSGYRLQDGTLAIGTANGGIVNVDANVSATIASDIADGFGDRLVKVGTGTLVLEGPKSYTGGTAIDGGVLSVSQDVSLGQPGAGLSLAGGTLQITGSDYGSTTRPVVLDAGGGAFDITDAGGSATLAGPITGSGDLTKLGPGTLVLTGADAYGDTLVQAGTLVGNSASISGNIANAGTVIFDQSADADFAGSVDPLDGTAGTMVKQGTGNLTLTGTSALDWDVQAGTLTSSAERFAGNAAIGPAGIFVLDQTQDAAYSGTISGQGELVKAGPGTLAYDGNSPTFNGMSRIEAGSLVVGSSLANASTRLGGSITVLDDATLGGLGTVGSGAGSTLTVASGGTLAPGGAPMSGTSEGTLTVDGDLVVEPGARYEVGFSPNAVDFVHVTGDATLKGGMVFQLGTISNAQLYAVTTILAADGQLTGTFAGVSSNYAFLTPNLLYDYAEGTVGLQLSRNEVDFTSRGQTPNQRAAAAAIDSIGMGAGHMVYDAIVRLPNDDNVISRSFNQVTGEIHASTKAALIEDSRFVREAAINRVRGAFGGVAATAIPVMAPDTNGAAAAPADSPDLATWGHVFGGWGSFSNDGNAGRLNQATSGFLLGADTTVFEHWRLGVLGGYSHTNLNAPDPSASAKSENYHLGLYGGTQLGALGLRTGLAYSLHDIDSGRRVSLPGLREHLDGDYRAGT
ncbi:outer membrane autotransporter barrel domain-containing protein [Arboricoccus pini]|uniref:Outer membrane autotransporter barrel domain-containing protein n=1 Tax=Arboricoccus pini TaxID=1963835 RepID=A0A212PW82_9PROT|nr:outer membrane autotransporter barrel domain-containing protein [Arboricoccus pini]